MNRIVPLGESYLELVAVVEKAEAAPKPVRALVDGVCPGLGRPLGWAVRTDELEAVAGRLSLSVQAGSRVAPR